MLYILTTLSTLLASFKTALLSGERLTTQFDLEIEKVKSGGKMQFNKQRNVFSYFQN